MNVIQPSAMREVQIEVPKVSRQLTLPNDKILDPSKLKPFAEDKINVTEQLKFVLGRAENIVGKEENVVTSIFSFSYNVF